MKKSMLVIAGVLMLAVQSYSAVTINVNEVYNEGTSQTDIVWDWSGSIDITGATQGGLFGGFGAYVRPYYAELPLYSSPNNTYPYSITGPSFGSLGDGTSYNGFTSVSGNTSFGVSSYGSQVYLAQFYVSGSAIYGTNVMANKTISGIGLNSGTYTWTVTGSGDTIQMNVNTIPEPATALILGLGSALLIGYRRFFGRA